MLEDAEITPSFPEKFNGPSLEGKESGGSASEGGRLPGRLEGPPDESQANAWRRIGPGARTLIKTFLLAGVATILYQVVKDVAFPRITLFQSQGITVVVVGMAACLGRFAAVRSRTRHQLRTEGKFRLLFASNPLPMWVWDRDTYRFLEVNDAAVARYGYSRDEFLQLRVTDIRPAEDIPLFKEYQVAPRPSLHDAGIWRHRLKNGQTIFVRIVSHLLEWSGHRAILAVAEDVTEHELREQALRETREQFRTAFEQAPFGMCLTGLDGRFLQVNAALCQLLGYSQEELLAGAWQSLTHPDDHEISREAVRRLQTSTSAELEKRYIHKLGYTIWVHLKISAVKSSHGETSHYITHIEDITEGKRAETALRESERRYRQLFERNLAGVLRSTLEGQILDCNVALAQMLGYASPDEVKVLHSPDLYYKPEDRRGVMERLRSEKFVRNFEVTLRRKGGGVVWAIVNANLMEDEAGKPCIVEGTLVDITERKQAESALQRQAALLDLAYDAIIVSDVKGRIQFWNRGAEETYGWIAEEAIGQVVHQLLQTKFPVAFVDLVASLSERGKWEGTLRHVARDGSTVAVASRLSLQRTDTGTPHAVLEINRNITEREQAEDRVRLLLDFTAEAIYGVDINGYCTFANPACLRMLRYESLQAVMGKNMHELVHHSRSDGAPKPAVHCRVFRAFEKGEGAHVDDEVLWRADGTSFPAEYWAYPVRSGGEVVGGVVTFLDISERKRAEEELIKAKEAAEAASQAKSQFLANMSHEIRTPMNGILGMSALALDTELNPEQRGYISMVKDSADSLLDAINRILDFSKIESGKLDVDAVEFHLRDTLVPTLKTLALRAHQKGLELNCAVSPDVPEALVGDPGLLRQIMVNLVGNAIKFTEHGEVNVQVDRAPDEEGADSLHFKVQDTGIGIPAEHQARIFDAFTQADGSTTRTYGGTGLGLTISRRLAEMLGGRIWLESEPGEGSTFHFTTRFATGEQAGRVAPEAADLAGLPVLVVDDNFTNRCILEGLLGAWRMRPVLAEGARPALTALEQRLEAGLPFALVLVDVEMPEMDGFALVEEIRRKTRTAGTAIMMLTAAHQHRDAARRRELGVAAYLTKPVGESELLTAILQAVGGESRPTEPVAAPIAPALPQQRPGGLHILVAEDNKVNQLVVVRMLEREGHSVQVAGDGREALDKLNQADVDLVLMDVQMPVMGGLDAAVAVREAEKGTGKHVPIIALTAHAMRGDRERCLAAGMDGYLSKPIRAKELFEQMEALVPSRQRDGALA